MKDPALVVDTLGRVHVAWQDVASPCTTGHLDVITSVARDGNNRLQINVARPSEIGLDINDGLQIFGTTSFNGTYTVRSVTNGVVETNETVANGASEATGNLVSTDVGSCAGPDIYYARLDETGWSDVLNLSDVGGDASSSAPAMVVDENGDVHVVWQEAGNLLPGNGSAVPPASPADGDHTDLIHRVIDGVTGAISLPVVITTSDDASRVDDKAPALAAGGGVVVVAWEAEAAATDRSVLLSRWNGSTWSTPAVVTHRTGTGASTATTPSVGIGPSGVAYVAWMENSGRAVVGGTVGISGDRDIVLCPMGPLDATCPVGADRLISTDANSGNSAEPAVAVDVGGPEDDDESVHVVWSDNEDRASTAKRILHRRLFLQRTLGVVTGGVTSVTTSGNGQNPAVAVDAATNELVVVWTDNTAPHPEFTVMSSLGSDTDTDADGVFDRKAFSAAALFFDNAGTFTTQNTAPSVSLGAGREIYVPFVHLVTSPAPATTQIFVWGTYY